MKSSFLNVFASYFRNLVAFLFLKTLQLFPASLLAFLDVVAFVAFFSWYKSYARAYL